jgi:hypothetical protein
MALGHTHQLWIIERARSLAAADTFAKLSAWIRENLPDLYIRDDISRETLYGYALGSAQSQLTELADLLEQALTGPAASDHTKAAR